MHPDKLTHASNTEQRKHSLPSIGMAPLVLAALRNAGERPITATEVHKTIGLCSRSRVVMLLNQIEHLGFATSTLAPRDSVRVERFYTRSPALAADSFEDATLVYGDSEP